MNLEIFLSVIFVLGVAGAEILGLKKRFGVAVRMGAMTQAESSQKLNYQVRLLIGLASIFAVAFLNGWLRSL